MESLYLIIIMLLLSVCCAEASVIRKLVRRRRKECVACIDSLIKKYSAPRVQGNSRKPEVPSLMMPPASDKLQ